MSDNDSYSQQDGMEEEEEKFDIHKETKKIKDMLKEGLTHLSKTADNASFAFVQLNYAEKELENLHLALHEYPHVRYLNLSQNILTELPGIENMHSLLRMDVSQNGLENAGFLGIENRLVYLQHVNLSQNKLKTIPGVVFLPRLRSINLNENELESLKGLAGHQSLKIIEARKNLLKDMQGMEDLPRLQELYLADNGISTFEGLGDLPRLRRLHLRQNQIKVLPEKFTDLAKLTYLNLRENQIEDINENLKILQLESLAELNVIGNPFGDELGDARKEVVMLVCLDKENNAALRRHIPKINKEPLDVEELKAITDELKEIMVEEEAKRKEEEEFRRLAEEEARRLRTEEGAEEEGEPIDMDPEPLDTED